MNVVDNPPLPDGRTPYLVATSGHWNRDAQGTFEPSPSSNFDGDLDLEITYDAKTHLGRTKLDGHVLAEHRIDLQPREDVRVRFGVNLHEPDSHYDLTVRALRLRALSD
jgi:hypothetical protein